MPQFYSHLVQFCSRQKERKKERERERERQLGLSKIREFGLTLGPGRNWDRG